MRVFPWNARTIAPHFPLLKSYSFLIAHSHPAGALWRWPKAVRCIGRLDRGPHGHPQQSLPGHRTKDSTAKEHCPNRNEGARTGQNVTIPQQNNTLRHKTTTKPHIT